jgi:uncharacterized protein (TIGR03435 family)
MKRIVQLLLAGALAAILGTTSPGAQSSSAAGAVDAQPSFDVASVRRIQSDGGFVIPSASVRPGGRWVVQMAPLTLILKAIYPEYALPGRIVGGPPWIDSERFDIDARAEGTASRDSILLMARRLLADRFGLKVHVEPRQVDVYALVRARRDGKLGQGLREAVDCEASDGTHGAFAPAAPKAGERPPCGFRMIAENGLRRLSAAGAPLSSLIPQIQMMVDRTVLDRTGLTGTFAIEFEMADTRLSAAPDTSPTAAAPSIFTAVSQLGLRLESRKEMLEVLVIDRLEMPTSN